jgi:hypothetical protein
LILKQFGPAILIVNVRVSDHVEAFPLKRRQLWSAAGLTQLSQLCISSVAD